MLHQKCNKITLEILVNYFKMQGAETAETVRRPMVEHRGEVGGLHQKLVVLE